MNNNSDVTVRRAASSDQSAINSVCKAAFETEEEAILVEELTAQNCVVESLVAEVSETVVGTIVFSRLEIVCDDRTVDALALAPVAVIPEFQNRGIGSQLVREGLKLCKESGHHIVIVLGHPEFYPRFGFSSEFAKPLASPFSGDPWMAVELTPGALENVAGRVVYAAPFGID
ncbi:N-acetyltransferase [Thalassoglobus sp. JC818]|uniref:GNAT family N-acetyltransferase n=1 Tax=Thalassoglobus sp. JC818 TaxID=3232136 RepID=UPI00345819AF